MIRRQGPAVPERLESTRPPVAASWIFQDCFRPVPSAPAPSPTAWVWRGGERGGRREVSLVHVQRQERQADRDEDSTFHQVIPRAAVPDRRRGCPAGDSVRA